MNENIEYNLKIIDINNISSFLINSGFINKCFFSTIQTNILYYNSGYFQNLCSILEFNEKLMIKDLKNDKKVTFPSINKIFNINLNLEEIYSQYIYFTKETIPLNIFINWLIILDIIIGNFYNHFNFEKYKVFNSMLKYKAQIFDINTIIEDNPNTDNNIIKLDLLYKNLEKQNIFMGQKVLSDLIIAIYLMSLGNQLKINKEIPNLNIILNYFDLYNRIYISNTYISLFLYIEIIILINIHLCSNKNKKNYFEYNPISKNNPIYKNLQLNETNNISFFSPQKNSINKRKISRCSSEFNNLHIIENNILNFSIYDNDIPPNLYDPSLKIFMFQNFLKIYVIFYLSKNKIKFKINLTIENIYELMKKINNINRKKEELEIIENPPKSAREFHGPLAPNNQFAENLKNYIKVNKVKSTNSNIPEVKNNIENNNINNNDNNNMIFPKLNILDEIQTQSINLLGLQLKNKNNTNINIGNFNIEQIIIKLINNMELSKIRKLNTYYINYILNSNACYFQTSIYSFTSPKIEKEKEIDVTDASIMLSHRVLPINKSILLNQNKAPDIIDNLSIDDFFDECAILFYFLDYYSHIESKKLPKIIQIKLNSFKCNINQKTKSIQIYFNFSNIKEKKLYQFLKESKGMLIFIQKYQFIIRGLKEYKLYKSTIRVSQNNFRSNQLNYFFTFITHKIVDYIEEIKFNKITVYETQLNNYNPNMKVYLKDFYIKKKSQAANLKSIIQSCSFFNKIKVLLEFAIDLADIWDLIVFSDSEKDIKLLRTFDDNKLFFFITKENDSNENTNKYLMTIINENGTKNKINEKNIKNKSKQYEYLNIIMYTKNSVEDLTKIISVIQSLVISKNSVLDYKTNLICDRFFFEENILLDQNNQQLQINISNLFDDFFFISRKTGSIDNNYINIKTKKENKIMKEIKDNKNTKEISNESISNEYYNYDFFIGDDYVGVLNNHQYDISIDSNNNFYQLIYDYLSVLSSCLELIYFLLKSKNIFILRFVYIIRTKNDLYYSWEYKTGSIFIKKIKEFTSLFTLNIKNLIPLFCFITKKEKEKNNSIDGNDDNFYDVFIRLFLNLNKVAKNQELNTEFFKKIYKNIFKENSFELVAFSYEAFLFFNDFFIKNNYLKISNGEKFDKCNLLPIEGHFDYKNYMKILSLFNSKDKDNNDKLIVKNLNIFNFGIDFNYIYKNKLNILFGFSKIDYFINEYNNYIFNTIQYEFKQKKDALKKKFEEKIKDKNNKKNINKYIKKIKEYTFGNIDEINNNENWGNVFVFNSPINLYNNIIKDYIKEKMIIKTQKNELNVFQVEEVNTEIKNQKDKIHKENKKDCEIF